jgi:8-oxo-dGTP diphosphatase
MSEPIGAAGGVILRDGKVLLVHRPEYDDWTIPKGKLDPGETWEEAAVRELEEETGLRCELGAELGRTRYIDHRGRDKEVRYYLMTSDDEPVAQNEIDEVRWVALEDVAGVLSYERDAELLKKL